jgi:hypothetical protein
LKAGSKFGINFFVAHLRHIDVKALRCLVKLALRRYIREMSFG